MSGGCSLGAASGNESRKYLNIINIIVNRPQNRKPKKHSMLQENPSVH